MSGSSIDPKRLRKVAILVSSVDSDAARQILLQLSPEATQQVRQCLKSLGDVTLKERQQVLAEFQQIATARPPASSTIRPHEPPEAWHRLSTDAILRALVQERPLVIAVVLSQLAPERAGELLARLSPHQGCQALKSMTRLNEMSPRLKQEIDSYLTQRLGEHQLQLETEAENRRRLDELLRHAPEALQTEWHRSHQSSSAIQASAARPEALSPESNNQTTWELSPALQPSGMKESRDASPAQNTTAPPTVSIAASRIHVHAGSQVVDFPNPVDRSLMQLSFEELLNLPTNMLSRLLTESDPEVVLLALAGASPSFMQRLQSMIEKEDFDHLNQRIRQLGAMRIADIDEAQTRLTDEAKALVDQARAAALRNAS